jgi:F0F1-type ATP synthase delta subunit
MYHECQKLREDNSSLSQKNQNSIQIKDHEDKLKQLTLNNKQLSERLELETSEHKKHRKIMETELDEIQQKYGKKELQLNQAEVENKVYKKMVRKYENLVSALRQTVSITLKCVLFSGHRVKGDGNLQVSRTPLEF